MGSSSAENFFNILKSIDWLYGDKVDLHLEMLHLPSLLYACGDKKMPEAELYSGNCVKNMLRVE